MRSIASPKEKFNYHPRLPIVREVMQKAIPWDDVIVSDTWWRHPKESFFAYELHKIF